LRDNRRQHTDLGLVDRSIPEALLALLLHRSIQSAAVLSPLRLIERCLAIGVGFLGSLFCSIQDHHGSPS